MNLIQPLVPTPVAASPRLDLYAPIHKALRAWMFDTLAALGRVDGRDEAELAQVLGRVATLLGVCQKHIHHENEFMHVALESGQPGSAARAAREHEEHHSAMSTLHGRLQSVRVAQAGERLQALTGLYRDLALFIAENLVHMHQEETAHNAVLWARYTDAELGELHDRLVQSIAPQEMAEILRWMIPAVSHTERVGMLADMQGKMPPGAFEGVLQLARDHLPDAAWAALMRELPMPLSTVSGAAH